MRLPMPIPKPPDIAPFMPLTPGALMPPFGVGMCAELLEAECERKSELAGERITLDAPPAASGMGRSCAGGFCVPRREAPRWGIFPGLPPPAVLRLPRVGGRG